jgi:uncharacterized membrane protein YhaH (DUF805 family)
MDAAMSALMVIALFCALVTPAFVIGRRRGLRNPWVAFVPFLGVWIVLFESFGRSGWFALLAFIPTVGPLLLFVWAAVEVPAHHSRSGWWTLAFLIPGVNLVGYWFYAFTLPRDTVSFA